VDNPDQTKSDAKKTDELSELKGELNAIRSFVSSIYERESKAFWAVGVFATLLTLIAFGFNAVNTSKFDDAIERSERKIEILAGIFRPSTATVHGIKGPSDSSILMEATILPSSFSDLKFFRVEVTGSAIVEVSGGVGRLLGYSGMVTGPLADFSARNLNGAYSEVTRLGNQFGVLGTEGDENGRMISETAPLQVSVQRFGEFLTCGEAERAVRELIGHGEKVGRLGLIPLFSDIEQPVSEHVFFDVTVVQGAHPTCDQMANMERWLFEPVNEPEKTDWGVH
jgi:hypothetical protein